MGMIVRQISILGHGIIFFSRIPIKGLNFRADHEKEVLRYFSFFGLLLASLQVVLTYVFNHIFPFHISLLITLALSVLLTGAFHEDGLADSFDALWGGNSVEQREKILKDSTLGTYGVIALILVYFFKFESLKLLQVDFFRYFIMGNIISRFLAVTTLLFQKYQGDIRSKSQNVAHSFSTKNFIINFTVLAVSSFYFLDMLDIIMALPLFLITYILFQIIKSKMGFIRGDFLGAIQQVTEVSFYLLMLIRYE